MTDKEMEAALGEPVSKRWVFILHDGMTWRREPDGTWEPYPEDVVESHT